MLRLQSDVACVLIFSHGYGNVAASLVASMPKALPKQGLPKEPLWLSAVAIVSSALSALVSLPPTKLLYLAVAFGSMSLTQPMVKPTQAAGYALTATLCLVSGNMKHWLLSPAS